MYPSVWIAPDADPARGFWVTLAFDAEDEVQVLVPTGGEAALLAGTWRADIEAGRPASCGECRGDGEVLCPDCHGEGRRVLFLDFEADQIVGDCPRLTRCGHCLGEGAEPEARRPTGLRV